VTIIRSLIYGYLGAILGGLAVAVVAAPLQTSLETAAGAAAVTGVVFGLFGLLLPWRQALAAPARARRSRAR
jgi:hypothetical protein